jgi:hypothetical protein
VPGGRDLTGEPTPRHWETVAQLFGSQVNLGWIPGLAPGANAASQAAKQLARGRPTPSPGPTPGTPNPSVFPEGLGDSEMAEIFKKLAEALHVVGDAFHLPGFGTTIFVPIVDPCAVNPRDFAAACSGVPGS